MDLIERPAGVLDDVRRHPWELARARLIVRLVARFGLAGTERFLDVGAGDAWFARQLCNALPSKAELACWDISYSPEDVASITALDPRLSLTAERPKGRFGGILMLDVIEHVEDDIEFVRDTVDGSLAPRGWVLVTVPAYQALFCEHDRMLKHYRRYSRRALRKVLEAAGLEVCAAGALFHLLVPIRAAQVLRERVRGPSQAQGIGAWHGDPKLSTLMVQALELEGRLSLSVSERHLPTLPGLTNWAFCRQRQGSSA